MRVVLVSLLWCLVGKSSQAQVALLDEFAANFYKELDYNLECENGIRVTEDRFVRSLRVLTSLRGVLVCNPLM